MADIDRVDEESDRVLLMTLHSAKGLEFRHVYLAGMEDGVFPGYMSITSDDPLEIEEERRLAYVGITRAREELTLTCARQRMTRGETQYNPVSRFVREIPPLLMDSTPAPVKRKREESYEENSREKSLLRTRPYAAPAPARTRQTPVGGRPFGGVGFGKPISEIGAKPAVKPAEPIRPGTGVKAAGTAGPETAGRLGYDKGDRVRHARYGEGTVLKIEPGPRDSQVTVVFDEVGQKIMYAGFAKLQKV